MNADSEPAEDLATLWRQQPVAPLTLTAIELHAENQSLKRSVHRSLLVEYAGGALVIAMSLANWIFAESPASSITYVSFIAATLWVMRGLHVRLRDGGIVPTPANLLEFQRATLERLRHALATAWRWYLLPFALPVAISVIDRWLFHPIPDRPDHVNHIVLIGFTSFAVVCFVAVWLWHQLAAARLQRRIDYLDTFGAAPPASGPSSLERQGSNDAP